MTDEAKAERLKELAEQIQGGWRADVGKALEEAKSLLAHGEWLPWLKKHYRGSPRRAQQVMGSWEADLEALKRFNQQQLEARRLLSISHWVRICGKQANTKQASKPIKVNPGGAR